MLKKLLFLIILILIFFSMGITALADSEAGDATRVQIIEDSQNEMPGIQKPAEVKGGMAFATSSDLVSVYGAGTFESSAEFISDSEKSEYIDRMMNYYFNSSKKLQTALSAGYAVVMFFDGGSDVAGDVSKGYRNAAVCIVVRQDSTTHKNYIAFYNKNSTTIPDYPLAYQYDNGHDGYGMGILLDGIYNVYTRNHRDAYAAFNVRTGDRNCTPCLYMNNKGSFSLLNGTGINLHLRMMQTVSGEELKPTSAGCLLVGCEDIEQNFNTFVEALSPDKNRVPTEFMGYNVTKYENDGTYAGYIVVDRYLAKDNLTKIYKKYEAVEAITAFSTFSQNVQKAEASDKMADLEYYSSNLTGYVSGGKDLMNLPCEECAVAKTKNGTILINGVYKNNAGGLYYRVFTNNATYYISAFDVQKVIPRYDDVTIHNYNYPEIKELGKPFSVCGIIARKNNALSEVRGLITDIEGNNESLASKTSFLSSYSINSEDDWTDNKKTLDYALGFSKLSAGFHIYKIAAVVKNYYVADGQIQFFEKKIELVNRIFRVAPLVTFNAGEGTVNGEANVTIFADKNGNIKNLPKATLDGKYFVGWYTSGDEKVTNGTEFTASTEVSAKWSDTPVEPKGKPYASVKPVNLLGFIIKSVHSIVNIIFWWLK